MTIQALGVLTFAYLLGSIPTAYLVVRLLRKQDIRSLGDRNMGAKNTFHSIGKITGVLVALIDIAKGAFAILLAQASSLSQGFVLASGVLAIIGHDFPIFVKFRGGQGMAAMTGVFLVLFPLQTLQAMVVMLLTLLLTRNWDLSCGVGYLSLLILMWVSGQPLSLIVYILALLPTLAATKWLQAWQARRVPA